MWHLLFNKLYLHMCTKHLYKILVIPSFRPLQRKELLSTNRSFSSALLVSKDPLKQFENWHDYACNVPSVAEPNAMILATVKPTGQPAARVVLLRDYGPDGFMFHTHATSSKNKDIEQNPYAAVVFLWLDLCRSIRIEGLIEKVQPENLNTAGIQSEDRLLDDSAKKKIKTELYTTYIIQPSMIEFWQWQKKRSNDKIVFQKNGVNDFSHFQLGENGWFYQIVNQ